MILAGPEPEPEDVIAQTEPCQNVTQEMTWAAPRTVMLAVSRPLAGLMR